MSRLLSDKKENYFTNLLKSVKISEKDPCNNRENENDNDKSNLLTVTNKETTMKKDSISLSVHAGSLNEINSKHSLNNFKAKVIPNFTLLEVKKSNRSLTVPKSPQLKTKARSVNKLKEIK